MTKPNGKTDPLQRAIDGIQHTVPAPGESEEAGARVWARLSGRLSSDESGEDSPGHNPVLAGCDDYQALIGPYLAGRLPPSRTLLFEDHARTCAACRRALDGARRPETERAANAVPAGGPNRLVWTGLAAATILALALGGGPLLRLLVGSDASATAASVTGRLFRIAGNGLEPIAPGDSIGVRTPIRTASDSGALLDLSDGSRIELGERTEVSIVPARDGIRIDVERGQMIVRAAPQGDGHLYVSTDDIDVEVVGTIFSVNEGSKGARVSVLEGEVRVIQSSMTQSLFPGEQYSSSESLTEVPISEEIAWSQERAEYMALVEAFSGFSEEVARATANDLRYGSALLGRIPQGTKAYVAFPNLARTISTAYDVFVRRVESNAVTREWWNELENSESFDSAALESMVGYLRSFSDQVGNEVVFALVVDGDRTDPVVMTEVTDATLMGDLLRGLRATGQIPLAVATSAAELAAADPDAGIVAYVADGLLAFSPSRDILTSVVEGSVTFVGTPFHGAIAETYSEGVDWLFALDLDEIVVETGPNTREEGGEIDPLAGFLGFNQVDNLIVEHKTVAENPRTRAVMTFLGERTGLPSWIRDAGPMGSLEFISPDAVVVAGGLTRDAEAVVQEILGFIQANSSDAWIEIEEFQREHRFDLEYDLRSTFGGEFVVAIDGPLVPVPSWKLIAEVYNSAILQNTIDRMVFEINRVVVPEGHPPVTIEAETVGGQIYYALYLSPESPIHYTYTGGYMIAAPNRTLVTQALQYQQARLSLAASTAFRDLMPAGSENHCSAVAYQNVASSLEGLESWLSGLAEDAGEDAGALLGIMNRPATLVCVVASADRIEVLNEGESPFGWMEIGGASILSGRMGTEAP